MQGLDLAEAYFNEIGKPAISQKFPDHFAKMAIGLSGPGSECFGFDDERSRDHDWGPAFCIWQDREDDDAIGEALRAEYEKLPKTFQGYGPRLSSPGEEGRVGPSATETFFRTYTGLDHVPATNREWLAIPEPSLAVCTNGRVFHDPKGRFTRWREALLNFYPDDVRLMKLASRCITIAQYGQYNYERSLQRKEAFAAQYALIQFCADALSFVFLINRRYAPFYKWMHRAVKELPLYGDQIHQRIDGLITEPDEIRRPPRIEAICALLIQMLRREGLTDSTSDFLLDHALSVHQRITDPQLAARLRTIA